MAAIFARSIATRRAPRFAALLLAATLSMMRPAQANDGFYAIDASGLRLSEADRIAMVSERLEISFAKVKVRYRFKNLDDSAKTAVIGFPIVHPGLIHEDEEGPGYGGAEKIIKSFTITVNGKPVEPQGTAYQFRALPARPGADHKPIDVTAVLAEAGIDTDDPRINLISRLQEGPAHDKVVANLPEAYREAVPYSLQGWIVPWWKQAFAPGETLTIEHSYNPLPGGYLLTGYTIRDQAGRFVLPEAAIGEAQDHMTSERQQRMALMKEVHGSRQPVACPLEDPALTRQYLEKTLKARFEADTTAGTKDNPIVQSIAIMSYILETARSWTGPIGNFEMTVDGNGRPVLFCFPGPIETVDKERHIYRVQAFDFVPKANVDISRLE